MPLPTEPDPALAAACGRRRGLDDGRDAGLAFDLEVTPRELAAAAPGRGRPPDLRFVVDHWCQAAHRGGLDRHCGGRLRALAATAQRVVQAVRPGHRGGLGHGGRTPTWARTCPTRPARFGAARLMFGSDWPVCELAASYGQVLASRCGRSFPPQDLREDLLAATPVRCTGLTSARWLRAGPARSARGGRDSIQQDLQQRAMRALAGGVSSNTRLLNPHLIVDRAASGCRIWDADGTEYLDYLLGQGPNLLGYAPPRVAGEGAGRAARRHHLRGHAPPGDRGSRTRAGRARLGRDDAVRQLQQRDGAGRACGWPAAATGRPRRPRSTATTTAGWTTSRSEERGHGGRAGQPGPAARRAARRPGAGVERHRGVRAADGHPRQRRRRRDHGTDDAQRGRDRARRARLPGGGPADLHPARRRC